MSSSRQNVDGLAGALLGIGNIIAGLRFSARVLQRDRPTADDWLMIPSYIFFVGFMASMLYATHHRALGYSIEEVVYDPPSPEITVNIFIAIDVFGTAFLGCIKASALLFFQRVFCISGRRDAFRLAIWSLLTLTGIWTILYILLPIFQCGTDISNAWGSPQVQATACQNSTPVIESQSVTDAIFDFIILILPIPKVLALNTETRRRLGAFFVFFTAAVCLAASIAKTVILYRIFDMHVAGDPLVESTRAYFMWILEAGFAIIAVNLPPLMWYRTDEASEKICSMLSVSSGGSDGDRRTHKSSKSDIKDTVRSASLQHDAYGRDVTHHEPMPRSGMTVTKEAKQEVADVCGFRFCTRIGVRNT